MLIRSTLSGTKSCHEHHGTGLSYPRTGLFQRLFAHLKMVTGHCRKRKIGLLLEYLEERTVPAGTWATMTSPVPGGAQTMLLLSDGTVMVHGGGSSGASSAW